MYDRELFTIANSFIEHAMSDTTKEFTDIVDSGDAEPSPVELCATHSTIRFQMEKYVGTEENPGPMVIYEVTVTARYVNELNVGKRCKSFPNLI